MSQSAPSRLPADNAIQVTPVVRTGAGPESPEVGMIDVTVSAMRLTGFIMGGALIAGLLVGVLYTRFRQGRAITVIEERGGNHNFLRE